MLARALRLFLLRILPIGPRTGTKEKFDFLGFNFLNGKTRKGDYTLCVITSEKKLKAKRQSVKAWLRTRLNPADSGDAEVDQPGDPRTLRVLQRERELLKDSEVRRLRQGIHAEDAPPTRAKAPNDVGKVQCDMEVLRQAGTHHGGWIYGDGSRRWIEEPYGAVPHVRFCEGELGHDNDRRSLLDGKGAVCQIL